MTTLLQDVRYALRMLARAPVVSVVAALSLALGIAGVTTVLAIANSWLFESLPYHEQDRLVILREGPRGAQAEMFGGTSVGNFRDYQAAVTRVSESLLYRVEAANLTGLDAPEQLNLVQATPNLFDVLGVSPTPGRGFRPEEGSEGAGRVIVLDHDFWQRRFLGDPAVLGGTVTLDGEPYTVVGVTPEEFDLIPANVQAYTPTDFDAQREVRGTRGYAALARLAPGATVAQVQQELDRVWERLVAEHPDDLRGAEVRAVLLPEFFPGPTDRMLIAILVAVTLFGLLIACANVANLLLSRADERQKEITVRTALGAGTHRILRQLLTESVTLGVAAGAVGTALSVFVVRWTQGAMPVGLPRAMVPRLEIEVLVATLVVSVLAGIAFGLVPALQATRGDLREGLMEGSRGGSVGRGRKRLRNAFIIGEFAAALALLTGAGFLVQTFEGLVRVDPGFRQEGLLTFSLTVSDERYPEAGDVRVYQDALRASLEEVPGVEGVAAMSSLPRGMQGFPTRSYTVGGDEPTEGAELPEAGLHVVSPDYFATLEIEILQGRGIERGDGADGRPVVVVSRALADRDFPDGDVLGRTLTLEDEGVPREIVGVAETVLHRRIPLAGERGEAMYMPLAQIPRRAVSFALRFPGDPTAPSDDVRRAVWAVNPDQPVADVQTLDEYVATSLAGPRAISIFLGGVGAMALLLAAMGIYGVMAHSVAQQRREIGIRMALGAGRRRVVGMVTSAGLKLVAVGMLLGLPLSWLMYRAATNMMNLFGAAPRLEYAVGVAVALAAVAGLSAWLPALRASGVAPGTALRE